MVKKCFMYIPILLGMISTISVSVKADEALVPQTGQTLCYNDAGKEINCTNTGQDADILAGITLPHPRFLDNSDGTVTDNLTRLTWLKDANCFGLKTWQEALDSANKLKGDGTCGLTDGSRPGQWHLPNVRELQSLINYGFSGPALSNASGMGQWTNGDAFVNVQNGSYWSSTSFEEDRTRAWSVGFRGGRVEHLVIDKGAILTDKTKANTYYNVWPVR